MLLAVIFPSLSIDHSPLSPDIDLTLRSENPFKLRSLLREIKSIEPCLAASCGSGPEVYEDENLTGLNFLAINYG